MSSDREKKRVPKLPGGEALASLRRKRLRWKYDSGYYERLFGSSAPDWAQLGGCRDAELIKENARRSIYRVRLRAMEVYVKHYRRRGWQDWLKWEGGRCPARIEFQGCLLATERGVAAPRPLGWAQGGNQAVLVLKALPEGYSLEQFLWEDRFKAQREDAGELAAVMEAVGELAGEMHRAQLRHGDFHCGNIHLSRSEEGEVRAWLVDLYKVRSARHEGALSAMHSTALADMARLLSGLSVRLTAAQSAGLVERYLKTVQPHELWIPSQVEKYQQALCETMRRLIEKLQKKYDRRSQRDSRYTRGVRPARRWRGRVYLRHKRVLEGAAASGLMLEEAWWREALEQATGNYDRGCGLLKDERVVRQEPGEMESEGTLPVGDAELPVRVIYYLPRGWCQRIWQTVWRSQGLQAWTRCWRAIHRHEPTDWPLAYLERGRGGILRSSMLIGYRDRERSEERIGGSYQSILMVKPSSLGDIVRCLPIYYGLRRRWPRAEIYWMVNTSFADLLGNIPGLKVIEFHRKHYGRMARSTAALGDFIGFIRELRQYRFDLVVDLQGLFRSGLISYLTGAPERIGFEYARELAWLFYTQTVGRDEHTVRHVVEDNWAVAFPLGFHDEPMSFDLPVDEAARQAGYDKLTEAAGGELDGYAVLLCGGSVASKRWPAERFGELAARLYRDTGLRSVVLGAGATEEALAQEITERCEAAGSVVNLAGQTGLREMTELLRGAELIVGNDSGPLHIGAALGRPTVGLYGPTNPEKVGPYGQLDLVAAAGAEIERAGRYSKHPGHQIKELTVERVMAEVSKAMGERD